MTDADRTRAQYAKNLVQLRGMLVQAQAVAPKKYRGYTVADLTERVATYERLAVMPDAELEVWLSPAAIRERADAIRAARGWTREAC